MEKIKFVLNGCDISFIAEAPKDITLEQLLKQCDRIEPHWCACGIQSIEENEKDLCEEYRGQATVDIIIDYDDIKKVDGANCNIKEAKQ